MTADLFPLQEPTRPPCFMTLAARKKLGQGEGWYWCKFERVGADALLEGGFPPRFTKGKRKGLHNWKGVHLTKVVVTQADIDRAAEDYEASTGCCRKCAGSGQEWAGWHYQDGNSYQTCKRCSGSGKPKEVQL